MSNVNDNNCYFEGEKVTSEEMVCIATTCLICKGGEWKETNRVFVL